ncbi:flagellar hook-associated protein FlgL [Nautilia sp.]
MRVTQFTQYNNFVLNQQKTLNALTDVQTQISTGEKIQNMYDDPGVYVKYLKLNEELNSFTQVKSSATFAQTFANETDTTLNDFVTALGSFKSNLLKAANDTNDETSRDAIVSELESELAHLKDLANTSIDGKYIFSGSSFNVKPIDENYRYQGNDQQVKAFLGAGVEREYNIDGASLFLGRNDDYAKHISLNVPQYDKMKANPQFVVRGADGNLYIDKDLAAHNEHPDSDDVPVNIPVTADSQIRMLTGVEDVYNGNGSYTSGQSGFYVKGRKPDGESFTSYFYLDNSESVNDLLEKIGELYGNTSSSKVVDVSLNDTGEIQIKDVQSGKMLTDFYMVAADNKYYDSSKSVEENLKNIIQKGYYTAEFQKSDYAGVPEFSSVNASNSYFDPSVYKFGVDFKRISDHQNASELDKISDVLGNVNLSVTINGVPYSVGPSQTFQDLINQINADGYNAYMKEGELVIEDPGSSSLNQNTVTLTTTDSAGNPVNALSAKDSLNFDDLFMEKNGNEIKGNVSQIVKDYKISYFKDSSGNLQRLPVEKTPLSQTYATEDMSLSDTLGNDDMPQVINITYRDVNGELKNAAITLRDTEYTDANGKKHLSTFEVDGKIYDIYEPDGSLTPAHDLITTLTSTDPDTCEVSQTQNVQKAMTYRQLADVVSMLVTGTLPASDGADAYNSAVENAKERVSAGVDDKGRFYVNDNGANPTRIDLSMKAVYTDTSAVPNETTDTLYFQANDAVTVDSPQTDFFETLQKAIDAVKEGNGYPDSSSSDPRNFGIQGAIEAIDHIMDHVRREHAKIGAVSHEFEMTIERTEMLTLNVQQLQSDNIDTDLGEATMRLNSLQTSYQALLASIAKINNLTLLNYL